MPIVDTIQEEEKYGNDGNRPWGQAIVNTLEKVSVFGNNLIEVRIIIIYMPSLIECIYCNQFFVEQLLYSCMYNAHRMMHAVC